MEITTIKLKKSTKNRIEKIKSYKRETYEEVIQKILDILNICRISPEKARLKLLSIDKDRRKNNNLFK